MCGNSWKRAWLAGIALLGGCAGLGGGEGWKTEIALQTTQLGYRNWIVIAEASFPAHSRAGVRQVNSYQPVPVVLDEVLKALEQTEHVRPRIFLTRELRAVENDMAPGVDELREQLQVALHGHEAMELEQESLMTLVEDSRKSFDVLVIRTSTALPYATIFIELEPGYWDGESEQLLREKIQRERMRKLTLPEP